MLTENIFGEATSDVVRLGTWYSQSGTYNPYDRARYNIVRTTAATLLRRSWKY